MIPLALPGPIVDVAWLQANAGHPQLRLVDARAGHRLHAGTIPGAQSLDTARLPWKTSTPDAFARFVDDATTAVRAAGIAEGDIVVCFEEISGAYAARAVWMLHALGHPQAALLDGGLHAWLEAGGSLALPAAPPAASAWTPRIDPAVTVDGPTLHASLADPGLIVLDTRSDEEWDAGTIPGAVHLEWTRLLAPDGRLLPPDELRARFASVGIDADRGAVVPFCGGGYRAAHAYVALRTLGISACNYAPSWNEWGGGAYPIAATDDRDGHPTP